MAYLHKNTTPVSIKTHLILLHAKCILFIGLSAFFNLALAYDNPLGSITTGLTTSDLFSTNEGQIGPSRGGLTNQTTGTSLTNSGIIIALTGNLCFRASNGANQTMWNTNTGILYVIPYYGVGMLAQNTLAASVTNDGLITTVIPSEFTSAIYPAIAPYARIGSSYGIFVSSPGANVLNNGSINMITPGDGDGFNTVSNINSLINTGTISIVGDGDMGVRIRNSSTLTTMTNTGTISVVGANSFGVSIPALSSLTTLNNSQGAGNSAGALTYTGNLPTNYNIIVNNVTHYGQLAVTSGTGTMAFGVYGGANSFIPVTYINSVGATSTVAASSVNANGKYVSILQGLVGSLSGSIITGTGSSFSITGATGIYGGYNYSLIANGDVLGNWDLCFGLCNVTTFSAPSGPSTIDTQASLQNSAQKLRTTFNASAISTNFANMNTYDCNLFDTKGMCISAGGRYMTVDNPNSNTTSAVVVVGYKPTPNLRIGGFLDQNVSNNTPTSIKIANKNPLMGVFAVWNQNADGLGIQVKLANAYQDKDVNTTRDVIGTSEAGTGSSNLNTQSYVGELSYAFLANQDKTTLRPYLALRQTTIKQDAYTETGVANPLSYGSLKDRSTTALVGLKLNHAVTPKTTITASLGLEQDLEHSVDQYSATSAGISGLTSENFNDSIKRTRPVASAGAYYAVSKTQRISGDVYYQQLPFQSTGSTTTYFSYMIGL